MNLYIDIGNSNIKVYALDENHQKEYYRESTKKCLENNEKFILFLSKIVNKNVLNKVFVSSVVPTINSKIIEFTKTKFNVEPEFLSLDTANLVDFEIRKGGRIGADLIALSNYLAQNSSEGIMVNLGTATTITYVRNKKFFGAIICPGLEMAEKSLIQNASMLGTEMNLQAMKKSIGENTLEAVSIGVINGHAKMIEGLVKEISLTAKVYISGNNASKVLPLLSSYVHIEEATLQGLEIIFSSTK